MAMNSVMNILRSHLTAYVVVGCFVVILMYFGFRTYGWLGIGLVGITGLFISVRAEVFDAYGDPHERNGGFVVTMYARQMKDRTRETAEGAMKRFAEEARRHVFFRAINTVFGALAIAGGTLHFIH